MKRPRILDLYCGQGGAGKGYYDAGCEVVGVDLYEQKRYPYVFWQFDAIELLSYAVRGVGALGSGSLGPFNYGVTTFDAIHASPPCQAYTKARHLQRKEHPKLIEPTRELLIQTGLPYIIENVVGAPLINPITLTGGMFPGLRTNRPRLFETNWPLEQPYTPTNTPRHSKMGRPVKEGEWMHVVGNFSNAGDCTGAEAMGIDWMNKAGLSESIPPAYTEWIGHRLREYIGF